MMLEQAKKKIHFRNTDFFLKAYRPFTQDVDRGSLSEIGDLQLQILGHGVFNPKQLLQNFMAYILQLLRVMRGISGIKTIKITINGFVLDPSDPVLQKIAKQLPSIRENLVSLSIRTSNLRNVTLKDFNDLLRLAHVLSDINFQDFSLECANWAFVPNQPNFRELRKIFQGLILQSGELTKIMNKHFRIQMSGWYYSVAEAKAFLGFKPEQKELKKVSEKDRSKVNIQGVAYSDELFFKELQNFFTQMERLISQLLVVMDNVEQLELDMRNTSPILKMSSLQKRLNNLSKDNRSQKSLISKRNDYVSEQAQKQLKLNIIM